MLTRSESTLKEHGDAFKATTKLLLAVVEDWNTGLSHTLFFPQKLLPVLAEYAVSPDLQPRQNADTLENDATLE